MKREFSEQEIPEIAREVLNTIYKIPNTKYSPDKAITIALSGDLGAGKTTLTKEIAKQLGITETVISPTYVIMKSYPIVYKNFETFVHIDAYRLESEDELTRLGWNDLIADPKNLIIIEWPEKVKNLISENIIWIKLSHTEDEERTIEVNF